MRIEFVLPEPGCQPVTTTAIPPELEKCIISSFLELSKFQSKISTIFVKKTQILIFCKRWDFID